MAVSLPGHRFPESAPSITFLALFYHLLYSPLTAFFSASERLGFCFKSANLAARVRSTVELAINLKTYLPRLLLALESLPPALLLLRLNLISELHLLLLQPSFLTDSWKLIFCSSSSKSLLSTVCQTLLSHFGFHLEVKSLPTGLIELMSPIHLL